MNLFCPLCGRMTRYNAEVVGVSTRLCPACKFFLEKGLGGCENPTAAPPTEGRLKPFGLTLVSN